MDDVNVICDDYEKLKNLRRKNPQNIIVSYLNINSIRNKFENLCEILNDTVDVFTVAETKLDDSFPTDQFLIDGFRKPFRLNISDSSGGLLTYVRSDIPARELDKFKFDTGIQIIPIQINLRKQKWVIFNIYRHKSQKVPYFLNQLSSAIDFYAKIAEKVIIIGDFNLEPTSPMLKEFLELNGLHNFMHHKTCMKSDEGSCIDLILSNQKFSLQHTGVFETGLSDFHLLIYTMLKVKYVKLPPKKIQYRKYKDFIAENFLGDLRFFMNNCYISTYAEFETLFTSVLEYHAPLKTKFVRANHRPHVTKELRKAIMKRSKLKRIANKTKRPEDMQNYRSQRNLVVKMNRKAKVALFDSINIDSTKRDFWKMNKKLFSSKCNAMNERIQLIEKNDLVTDDKQLSSIFNEYFNKITDSLDIRKWHTADIEELDSPSACVRKFSSHPSIVKIQENRQVTKFEFSYVTVSEVAKIVASMDTSKKCSGSIPVKVLKLAANECVPFLTACFNSAIDNKTFPDELKLADIIPAHKNGSSLDKENYRPISLLPPVSKIFERIMADQLLAFTESRMSKYLCGFRKGHSTQYALLNMLRAWQSCLSKAGKVGAILMDLSKAFDCLSHELLIAKLDAYGIGEKSLQLLFSYLRNRKHRVRVGSCISDWLEIMLGVPQGSILGPILFNIFINDLLCSIQETSICNFADDNTIYATDTSLDNVIKRLECEILQVCNWFSCNSMVTNPVKFQMIFPGSKFVEHSIIVGNVEVKSTENVKLLGAIIDYKLSFYPHVKELCKSANQKTKALLRIRRYLTQSKANLIIDTYVLSPFNYCPLIWMFCSKMGHNLLESTHRRALMAKHFNFSLSYSDLLHLSKSVSIHTRNLRCMLLEVYKSLSRLSPEIMQDIFETKNSGYSLRNGSLLAIPQCKSTFAANTFDFRAVMAWNHLPSFVKDAKTLGVFKSALNHTDIYCRCKLCCIT